MTKDITFFTELVLYTEAKVDVTQEIEHRAQQASQAGADHCALCSISCVTSTLASVYLTRKPCTLVNLCIFVTWIGFEATVKFD